MKVTIAYETQLKRAIGTSRETLEVSQGATIDEVVRAAADRHDDAVRQILLNDEGNVRRSVLVFLDDEQIERTADRSLSGGETITLMSPVSGG